jgi:carbon-monoxide dehydrogenase small subunit
MPDRIDVTFTVNGETSAVQVPFDMTLADVLRDELGLTGTKVGCGEGECGACSIILDGKLVSSCLVLAAECGGSVILTIEGLAEEGRLHPIQESFVLNGAVQCGYCTPGMIMAAYALLKENPAPTEEEICRGLEGNICRCTGYRKIADAIHDLAQRDAAGAKESASAAGGVRSSGSNGGAESARKGGRRG